MVNSRPLTPTSPVAVVGYGLVVPGANTGEQYWQLLRRSAAQLGTPHRFDVDALSTDPEVPDRVSSQVGGYINDFRPHSALAAEIAAGRWDDSDVEALWLRHCVLHALDRVARPEGIRVANFTGAWVAGTLAFEETVLAEATARELAARLSTDVGERRRHEERLRSGLRSRFRHAARKPADILPHRLVERAIEGLVPEGTESLTLGAACASTLWAIDLGIQSLCADDSDLVLCGAAHANNRGMVLISDRFGGVTQQGDVRPFDKDADGTAFGDGAAVLTLKLLERAEADGDRILGVLSRPGLALDGRGKIIAAPNAVGVVRAVERGWAEADVGTEEVEWVVAHGTGTRVGDATEIEALSAARPPHSAAAPQTELLCTSNKALIGHTAWASAGLSVIQVLLAYEHGLIPAQQRFTTPHPDLDGTRLTVPATDRPWPARAAAPRTAAVNAMGIGGANGHLVIRDRLPASAEPRQPSTANTAQEPMVLVAWNARLPGHQTRAQTEEWLRTDVGSPTRLFGPRYPVPPIPATRLGPAITDVIDHTHLMALDVAWSFVEEHGELWSDLRERTGVITATAGLNHSLRDLHLRAGSAELHRHFDDAAESRALNDLLGEVRARQGLTEENFSGALPSIATNRITNRWDLHGTSLAIDAGPDSSRYALRTARRYLTDGRLDLALLLALNEAGAPEAGRFAGRSEGHLADGAFLLALTRESFARERGWPIKYRLDEPLLAALDTRAGAGEWDYYGAHGTLALLRSALRADTRPHTARTRRWATVLRRTDAIPVGATQPPADPAPEPFGLPAAIPQGGVVLVPTASLAMELTEATAAAGALLLSTDPATEPHTAQVATPATLPAVLDGLSTRSPHLRLVVRTTDADRPWPVEELRFTALLELAAQCLKRLHPRLTDQGGSSGALLLDPLVQCLPHPETAIFTGFFRSLALELPKQRTFALVSNSPLVSAMKEFEDESRARRDRPVIYRRDGLRYTEEFFPQPLPQFDQLPSLALTETLGERPMIVAAGGGRGITAVILRALAQRLDHPTLWILGRTDPAAPADILDAPEADQQQIRAAFLLEARRPGETIAEANERFEGHWQARELAHNLRLLHAICGPDKVHYLRCDLRDPEQVTKATDQIRTSGQQVDLLLHTARYQESATLAHKSIPGFRACLDTKIKIYRNLRAAFGTQQPRRWVNFGSSAGSLGFPGETDYTAANDFLAAAARWQTRLHGTSELTLGWGLWEESGKAAPSEARKILATNGIRDGVTDEQGTAAFLTELGIGHSAEPAPIYATPHQMTHAVGTDESSGAFAPPPLLGTPEERTDKHAVWTWSLDPTGDRYLLEHLVHGRPVAPAAALLSLAVEAAGQLIPGATVRQLRDARFQEFVWADPRKAGATKYRIRAQVLEPPTEPAGEGGRIRVELLSDITDRSGTILRENRSHYRVDALTGVREPAPTIHCHAPHTKRLLPDPYTWADEPISLTGVFRNVYDWSWDTDHCAARWSPPPAPQDSISHTTLPVLLCDALMRLSIIPVDGPQTRLQAPLRIGRIDFYQGLCSDTELALQYPAGLLLHRRREPGSGPEYQATDTHGRTLLALTDTRGIEFAPPVRFPPSLLPSHTSLGTQDDVAGLAGDEPCLSSASGRTLGRPENSAVAPACTINDISQNLKKATATAPPKPPPQRHEEPAAGPKFHPGIPATGGLPYYETEHIVTFGDVSSSGFMYYAKYIEWMGKCRERFGFEAFPAYMAACYAGTEFMLTLETSCEYLGELWVNDRAVVRMTAARADLTTMSGRFHIFRANSGATEQIVARGEQTWASALPDVTDSKTMHPAPWRPEVLARVAAMGGDTSHARSPHRTPEKTVNESVTALIFAKLRRLASCFDPNRNGSVNCDSFALAADRWGASADITGDHELTMALRKAFRNLWAVGVSPDGQYDKSGATYDQFAQQVMTAMADPAHPFMAATSAGLPVCFQIIDRDGDGAISEGEYTRTLRMAFGVPEVHSIAAFQDADRDRDGRISQDDFNGIFIGFLTGTDPEAASNSMMGRPL